MIRPAYRLTVVLIVFPFLPTLGQTAGVRLTAEPLAVTCDQRGSLSVSFQDEVIVDREELQLVDTTNGWRSRFSYGQSRAQQRQKTKRSITIAEAVAGRISYSKQVQLSEQEVSWKIDYDIAAQKEANRAYYFLNIPKAVLAGTVFQARGADGIGCGNVPVEGTLEVIEGLQRLTLIGPKQRIEFELAGQGVNWRLTDWTHTEHRSYRLRIEHELTGHVLQASASITLRVQRSNPDLFKAARRHIKEAAARRHRDQLAQRGFHQEKALHLGAVRANAGTVGQYEKLELTFDVAGTFDNPFDPEQIDVAADFTTPAGKRIAMPAFLYQEFAHDEKGIERSGAPVWKVRFAPHEPGRYSYQVRANNQGQTLTSPAGTFECTPRQANGYVRISKTNPLYCQYENGEPYVPSGINLFVSTRLGTPVPADRLQQCETWMGRLADAEGNFARLRMDSWWLAIEMSPDEPTGYLGLGYYHQPTCWEIDRIYDQATARGIFVMHCLDNANANVNLPPPKPAASTVEWRRPYNLYAKENGGVCEKPADFWSHPQARRQVRNKLRYCVARWGYHSQLMAWEFWNEVSCRPDMIEPCVAWHRDMARYLRRIDPFRHPITTSLMGDKELADQIWALPEMEIMQHHYYCRSEMAPNVASMARELVERHHKPFFLGEYGLAPQFKPGNCSFDATGVHMHNGMWAALFGGGCGAGAMWYVASYVDRMDLYHQYRPLAGFARRVPWCRAELKPCQVDCPTLVGTPKSPHYIDLRIPSSPQYGLSKPPETDFVIEPDGHIANSQMIRPALHCAGSRKAPPTFHVTLARPAQFVIKVSLSVGQAANKLLVFLDDQQIVDEPFPAGEQFSTESVYISEYDNWRTPYDKEIVIDLPSGRHAIRPEAKGKDRLEVEYCLRNAIAFEDSRPLRVLGMATGSAAYLWFQNRTSVWRTAWEGGQPIPLPEMSTRVRGLSDGTYRVQWYDPWTGKVSSAGDTSSRGGVLPLTIPPVTRDIACVMEAK